jgi:HD-like signal output (HDOD) protein
MRNKSILFVDDEIPILNSLRRVFSGRGYNIFLAGSGDEALSVLAREKVDMVITDVRMPGMNGYELLREIKAVYPSLIRVVLSGYTDEKLVVQIQKMSLAKRYLFKPWKNQELIRIVEQIFNVEKVLKSSNLLELVNKIESLPSPGGVYLRFCQLVEQDADMGRIAAVIESDQSLAAKVLHVANSAIYGVRTGSVRQAVTYLGLSNVRSILLGATTFDSGADTKNIRLNRDVNVLWRHAVTTNQMLMHLYRRILGRRIPDICSMAGLLHDIGKVVLINNFTDRYLKAAAAIQNKKDLFYYYEKMEFTDVSHQEIGAYLLNWWELPQILVESVLYHHDPLDERVTDKELLSLLNIAEIYSWNGICGGEYWSVDPQVLEYIGISKEDCDQITGEIEIDKIIY